MTAHTKIEWADHTFSPWIGCTRVSEGCRHCYAETLATNRLGLTWGPQGARRRTAASTWKQPLAWNRKAEREGRRYSVFPSMCDVFDDHASVVQGTLHAEFGELIGDTENLDWLLLTKRPENLEWGLRLMFPFVGCPPPNVRIGVSVEDQATADQRIPELLRQWHGPNFVSYEPALGPVDFTNMNRRGDVFEDALERGVSLDGRRSWPSIDWIIAGGESGPGARPAHPDWFRSVRDQCQSAGVAFFMKQWGEWDADALLYTDTRGNRPPQNMRVGKKRAGRLLDGREWNEFPQ